MIDNFLVTFVDGQKRLVQSFNASTAIVEASHYRLTVEGCRSANELTVSDVCGSLDYLPSLFVRMTRVVVMDTDYAVTLKRNTGNEITILIPRDDVPNDANEIASDETFQPLGLNLITSRHYL
jgi:hypothetical protein